MAINNKHYRADLLTQFPKEFGQSDDDYKNKVLNKLMDCIPKMDKNTTIQAIRCLIREIMGGHQLDHNHHDLELLSDNPAFKNHIQIITGNSSRFFAVDKTRGAIMFLFALCERLSRLLEPRITIENDRPTRRQKVQFVSQVLLSISPLNNDTGSNKNYTLDNAELGVMFNLGNNRRPISLSLGNDHYLDECHIIKANPTGDVNNVQIGENADEPANGYYFGANKKESSSKYFELVPIKTNRHSKDLEPIDPLYHQAEQRGGDSAEPHSLASLVEPSKELVNQSQGQKISENLQLKEDIPETLQLEELDRFQTKYKVNIADKILDCFHNQSINLDLSDCGLTKIPTKILSMLPHLQSLDLSYNKINKIPENAFAGLPNLNELSLAYNDIHIIKSPFAELPSLEKLDLSCNEIHSIAADVFKGLTDLLYLDLGFNKIKTIATIKSAGINLSRLRDLDLHLNKINQIPKDAFTLMTDLRRLNLSENPIEEIAEGTFAELINLSDLCLPSRISKNINILDPLLCAIHKNIHLKDEYFLTGGVYTADLSRNEYITLRKAGYGLMIEIDQVALIHRYIMQSDNATLQNYCLQLLLHDNLQEPEAIKLLATGIYSGAIPLAKVYPQKTLDWICNLFNKNNLSMLDFLAKNKKSFEQKDLQSVVISSQLISPKSSIEIETSTRKLLIKRIKDNTSMKRKNLNNDVRFVAVINEFTTGRGIVKLVDNQIIDLIKNILSKAAFEDIPIENLNNILTQVKSSNKNVERLKRIGNALNSIINQNAETSEEIKDNLLLQLGEINLNAILKDIVSEYCEMLGINENENKLEEFHDWQQAVRNHTSVTLKKLSEKTMTAIETFKGNIEIYSNLLLSCSPYLSYGYIQEIVEDKSPRVTQECKNRLNVILDYCKALGSFDDDHWSLVQVFCIDPSLSLLVSIDDLSKLNPLAARPKLDGVNLITLDHKNKHLNGVINANNFKEIEGKLPMWFAQCIKKQFTLANTMANVLVEFINKILNIEKIELTPSDLDKLTTCLYANAQNFGGNLNIPSEIIQNLMMALKDQRTEYNSSNIEQGEFFEDKFAQIAEKCREEYIRVNEYFNVDKMSNKELDILPEMLIQKLKKDPGYCIITDEVVEQLIKEFGANKSLDGIKPYEILYLLGGYFANLSSINGLGYHSGSDNRSFTRFRLYAAMCLSRCVEDATNDLPKAQKMRMCQEIKNLLLTAECSGQIANRLFGDYALFGELTKRIRKILETVMLS